MGMHGLAPLLVRSLMIAKSFARENAQSMLGVPCFFGLLIAQDTRYVQLHIRCIVGGKFLCAAPPLSR